GANGIEFLEPTLDGRITTRVQIECEPLGPRWHAGELPRDHQVARRRRRISRDHKSDNLASVTLGVASRSWSEQRFPDVTLEVRCNDRRVDIIAEGYDVVVRVGRSDDSIITSRKIAVVKRGLFGAKSLIRRLGPITTP